MSLKVPSIINTLFTFVFSPLKCQIMETISTIPTVKVPSKDTANPLSHQVIASSNLFSSTQAMAPVGNNTKKHIITVAQF